MNIYSIRFAVNKPKYHDNSILEIQQFGHNIEEIETFWKQYFNKGRNEDDYTFIDCTFLREVSEADVKCKLNEALYKKFGDSEDD